MKRLIEGKKTFREECKCSGCEARFMVEESDLKIYYEFGADLLPDGYYFYWDCQDCGEGNHVSLRDNKIVADRLIEAYKKEKKEKSPFAFLSRIFRG